MCFKPKSTYTKTARPNVNSTDDNTTDNSVNALLNKKNNLEYEFDCQHCSQLASIASYIFHIEPKNTILRIGNTKVVPLIDPGIVCSIQNESFATGINSNSFLA